MISWTVLEFLSPPYYIYIFRIIFVGSQKSADTTVSSKRRNLCPCLQVSITEWAMGQWNFACAFALHTKCDFQIHDTCQNLPVAKGKDCMFPMDIRECTYESMFICQFRYHLASSVTSMWMGVKSYLCTANLMCTLNVPLLCSQFWLSLLELAIFSILYGFCYLIWFFFPRLLNHKMIVKVVCHLMLGHSRMGPNKLTLWLSELVLADY